MVILRHHYNWNVPTNRIAAGHLTCGGSHFRGRTRKRGGLYSPERKSWLMLTYSNTSSLETLVCVSFFVNSITRTSPTPACSSLRLPQVWGSHACCYSSQTRGSNLFTTSPLVRVFYVLCRGICNGSVCSSFFSGEWRVWWDKVMCLLQWKGLCVGVF